MCAYMCVCLRVCTSVSVSVSVYKRLCVSVYLCMCVCECVCDALFNLTLLSYLPLELVSVSSSLTPRTDGEGQTVGVVSLK